MVATDQNKVKVQLVSMGNITSELDLSMIEYWDSQVFEVIKGVKSFILPRKSDLPTWGYSDQLLNKYLSKSQYSSQDFDGITVYILDAPIQNNHFSRILDRNRIVITFHEIKEILQGEYIPLENFVLSCIYTYALLYRCKAGSELTMTDEARIAHDYREGCLYDMCGDKTDVVSSCVKPQICERCQGYLLSHQVSKEDIQNVQEELKRLRRTLYWTLATWLKKNPIYSLAISLFSALGISMLSNIIYSCIHQ